MKTNENSKTDSERLKVIIDLLHLPANRFAKVLEYKSPSSVYHVLDGLNSISSSMAERIVKKFPQVNYIYLRTGEGTPILTTYAEKQAQENLFQGIIQDLNLLEDSTSDHEVGSLQTELRFLNQQIIKLVETSEQTNRLLQKLVERKDQKLQ